jgi:hypothetical protein
MPQQQINVEASLMLRVKAGLKLPVELVEYTVAATVRTAMPDHLVSVVLDCLTECVTDLGLAEVAVEDGMAEVVEQQRMPEEQDQVIPPHLSQMSSISRV